MGADPVAGHCRGARPAFGLVRSSVGRSRPSLAMVSRSKRVPAHSRSNLSPSRVQRSDPVQRVWAPGRDRILAHVRPLPVHFGGGRRPLHGPGQLPRLAGAQQSAHRGAAVLHAVREHPLQPVHAEAARVAERTQQRSVGHEHRLKVTSSSRNRSRRV